jgi:hypothetical protein
MMYGATTSTQQGLLVNDNDSGDVDDSSSFPATGTTHTSNHRGNFLSILFLRLVPERSPRLWSIIDHILAVTGCFLIIDLCVAQVQVSERRFAAAYYLIFSFGTCLMWLLQCSLSYIYQRYYDYDTGRLRRNPNTSSITTMWYTKLELLIALYFVTTTGISLYKWKIHHGNLVEDATKLWEVALDTLFYVYLVIRSWTCSRSKGHPTT